MKMATKKLPPWLKEAAAEKKIPAKALKKHEKKESPKKAAMEKKRGY
jgi:hypothetical protein